MSKSFRLTREELYKLVWSEPKIELAKGLGISDVAITKICRKLSVPMPPQGYWLQKHKPKKPALPATKGAPFHVVHLYEPRVSPEVVPLDPQAAILLAYEENPKHKIIVGKKLHSPHPFVAAARQAFQKMEPDKLTQLMPRHIDRLYVAVGKASVPRALLILDALLKALERRKFLVKMEDGFVQVTILDEVFLFGVDERRKHVMPVLNKIQNAQKALNPTLYTGRSYLLTGLLNLKQFSPWGRSPWVILSDNDKHKLEDCLNSFIVKLIHAAMERKAARLERQRQDEECRRREEERALRAKLLAEENARIAGLKSDVADWEQSRLIRGYIEAVRQKASANGMSLQPEGEFGRWILWAEAIADRLDPLLRANPFREMSA